MNSLIKVICAVMLALAAVGSAPAFARGHVHFGIGLGFGGPAWYPAPYYYPAPVYYYPAPVVVQQGPTYIEQPAQTPPPGSAPQSTPQTATDNSWYYCRDSQAYYPYVQSCGTAWQRVPPRPGS